MTKLLNLFRKPSPMVVAMTELVEAEHALLVAQTGLDWAQASVHYNQARIERLTRFLAAQGVSV